MPKFTLPELPDTEGEKYKAETAPVSDSTSNVWPSEWERKIRIPVNKKIIDALEVGKDVQITLRGDVSGLNSSEEAGQSRNYLEVVVDSVEAYPAEEIDEEAAMEAGYKGD